jgi:GGDEF domain-containing protein
MPMLRALLERTMDAAAYEPAGSQKTGVAGSRVPSPAEAAERMSNALTLDPACGAYNEDAFRYFLEIERRRAEASGRPLLLLLVDLKKQSEPESVIPGDIADRLFSSLALCLRDTDFFGWYREGRVAGAVLTQHTETSETSVADVVAQRVSAALQNALPTEVSIRVQVRVYHVPATATR